MLGPQVGLIVKSNHDIKYYKNLYEHFKELLEALMSRYNIKIPNFITIHIKEVFIEERLLKNKISLPPLKGAKGRAFFF
jgi:hypothetical protein